MMMLMVSYTAVFQTAFSDFLMGSSKDLAKHIKVVVSVQALFSENIVYLFQRLNCPIMGMLQNFDLVATFSWSQ